MEFSDRNTAVLGIHIVGNPFCLWNPQISLHFVSFQSHMYVDVEGDINQFHSHWPRVLFLHGDCVQVSVINEWLEVTVLLASGKNRSNLRRTWFWIFHHWLVHFLSYCWKHHYCPETKVSLCLIEASSHSEVILYLNWGGRNWAFDSLNMLRYQWYLVDSITLTLLLRKFVACSADSRANIDNEMLVFSVLVPVKK